MQKMEQIQLNEEQERVVRCLERFLSREPGTNFRKNSVLLVGAGGVGKTTTVREFCLKNLSKSDVALACPTHKAAEVLRKGMKGFKVETIHKFLGLDFVYDKEGNGKMKRIRKLENTSYVKLLVVDECSMIDKQLLEYIGEWSRFHMAKVLFLGDKHQLPPVNSGASPVFELIQNNRLTLTKNMRTRDDSIAAAHLLFREAVTTKTIDYPESWQMNSENPDASVFLVPDQEFLISEFVQKCEVDEDSAVVLAWRNKTVFEYNCLVRKALFGEKSRREPYIEGERMIFHRYFISGGHEEGSKKGTKYTTCERTKVIGVEPGLYPHPWFNECLHAHKLTIKSLSAVGGIDVVFMVHKKDKAKYEARCKEMKGIYRDSHFILSQQEEEDEDEDKQRKKKEWREYYRIADSFQPPLSYSYSMTIHKSQASTFEHVFVILSDVFCNRNKSEAYRCAYTGVSRAAKTLYIF